MKENFRVSRGSTTLDLFTPRAIPEFPALITSNIFYGFDGFCGYTVVV